MKLGSVQFFSLVAAMGLATSCSSGDEQAGSTHGPATTSGSTDSSTGGTSATGGSTASSSSSGTAGGGGGGGGSAPLPTSWNLDYSTYLGGSAWEHARDIFVDSQGNAYVVGGTQSWNFPVTPGAYDTSFDDTGKLIGIFGHMDGFITKYSPTGVMLWSTFLGGPNYDRIYAVEVDPQGFVYVTGRAGPGFPVTSGALQEQFKGSDHTDSYGWQNAFAAKLSPDGSSLLWATYVGVATLSRDLALDAQGNVYLTPGNPDEPSQGSIDHSWYAGSYQATPDVATVVRALMVRLDLVAASFPRWGVPEAAVDFFTAIAVLTGLPLHASLAKMVDRSKRMGFAIDHRYRHVDRHHGLGSFEAIARLAPEHLWHHRLFEAGQINRQGNDRGRGELQPSGLEAVERAQRLVANPIWHRDLRDRNFDLLVERTLVERQRSACGQLELSALGAHQIARRGQLAAAAASAAAAAAAATVASDLIGAASTGK